MFTLLVFNERGTVSTLMCLHFRCSATKLLNCYTAYHISFMSCCLFASIFHGPCKLLLGAVVEEVSIFFV